MDLHFTLPGGGAVIQARLGRCGKIIFGGKLEIRTSAPLWLVVSPTHWWSVFVLWRPRERVSAQGGGVHAVCVLSGWQTRAHTPPGQPITAAARPHEWTAPAGSIRMHPTPAYCHIEYPPPPPRWRGWAILNAADTGPFSFSICHLSVRRAGQLPAAGEAPHPQPAAPRLAVGTARKCAPVGLVSVTLGFHIWSTIEESSCGKTPRFLAFTTTISIGFTRKTTRMKKTRSLAADHVEIGEWDSSVAACRGVFQGGGPLGARRPFIKCCAVVDAYMIVEAWQPNSRGQFVASNISGPNWAVTHKNTGL